MHPCRIDAHHHLWRFNDTEFGWIADSMAVLRRTFAVDELAHEAASAGVKACVAVQARQSIEETEELLRIAEMSPLVQAVVGWLPLASPGFAGELDRYHGSKYLKGVRHVVQAEPPGFLTRSDFNQGMQAMQGSGLTYDLLILHTQLQEAIRFVDRYPNQLFVLDHLAKPAIDQQALVETWAFHLAHLAERPNVFCKLSGLVTEAPEFRWSLASLAPCLDVALRCFGADRLMVGTDWPVLTVGCSYSVWWQTIEAWSLALGSSERAAILGGTAKRFYSIELEDPSPKAL